MDLSNSDCCWMIVSMARREFPRLEELSGEGTLTEARVGFRRGVIMPSRPYTGELVPLRASSNTRTEPKEDSRKSVSIAY